MGSSLSKSTRNKRYSKSKGVRVVRPLRKSSEPGSYLQHENENIGTFHSLKQEEEKGFKGSHNNTESLGLNETRTLETWQRKSHLKSAILHDEISLSNSCKVNNSSIENTPCRKKDRRKCRQGFSPHDTQSDTFLLANVRRNIFPDISSSSSDEGGDFSKRTIDEITRVPRCDQTYVDTSFDASRRRSSGCINVKDERGKNRQRQPSAHRHLATTTHYQNGRHYYGGQYSTGASQSPLLGKKINIYTQGHCLSSETTPIYISSDEDSDQENGCFLSTPSPMRQDVKFTPRRKSTPSSIVKGKINRSGDQAKMCIDNPTNDTSLRSKTNVVWSKANNCNYTKPTYFTNGSTSKESSYSTDDDDDDSADTSCGGEVYDWLVGTTTDQCTIASKENESSSNINPHRRVDCEAPVSNSKLKHCNNNLVFPNNPSNKMHQENLKQGTPERNLIQPIGTDVKHEVLKTPVFSSGGISTNNNRSKTMFTPPTPQCDSPLARDIEAAHNHASISEVKDTIRVKRKKAALPTRKPDARMGNWLTNRYIVNNYILLNQLGTGSYAEVRLCKEKNDNKLYAIKIMNKDFLKKKSIGKTSFMDDVKREVAIMKKLRHPNVLRLYEVLDDPKVNKLYMILEYMKNGDLMQITQSDLNSSRSKPLSDEQVWDIARQILRGLKYLHDNSVVHGDIKPNNILVSDDGMVKIADFGVSKMIKKDEMRIDTAGTPAFMPPELCGGEAYDGKLADMYALGATLYCIRCGHPPFVSTKGCTPAKNKLSSLYYRIQNDPITFTIPVAEGLTNLLEGLMKKNPTERINLLGAMKHYWLQRRPNVSNIEAPCCPLIHSYYNKVEITDEDILLSIHRIKADHVSPDTSVESVKHSDTIGQVRPAQWHNVRVMGGIESERRLRIFHQQASLKTHSFAAIPKKNQVPNALQVACDYSDGSDESDNFCDSPGGISQVGDKEFDLVMNTLSQQPKINNIHLRTDEAILDANIGSVTGGAIFSTLGIRVSHHIARGSRLDQEDRVTLVQDMSELLPNKSASSPMRQYGYFAVFDGHNGYRCANALHERFHFDLISQFIALGDMHKAIDTACREFDKFICQGLRQESDTSGSTGLIILLDSLNGKLTVANVGDSRCVLSRGGAAMVLTTDHRVTNNTERRRIIARGGNIKNNRVNGVLAGKL